MINYWLHPPRHVSYSTMPLPAEDNQFPVSLYATPNPVHQSIFYTVPRAGHLVAGTKHHINRKHFPGHELILCLRGRGWTRIGGKLHSVQPGEFVWINCRNPHEHGSHPADPWEVYWIRVEGPKLEEMCHFLSVAENPVFTGFDAVAAVPVFETLFHLIPSDVPEAPAFIHASVAQLLSLAFSARARHSIATPSIPVVLTKAVETMKLFFFERHTVDSLAKLSGMSATHFARLFKSTFGTSPIDWLRRERINQAKRRLVETPASIEEIAEQVGFHDRYFFSKDFKKHTGMSPREFRLREPSG